ncbi:MAG: hypothetical protein K0R73_803 [Candidatus Midichloriaceae bacterium]|jgi:hypothetical protein|nr:hypothetical protein [Candidatus Midichloriaceae bacterium]
MAKRKRNNRRRHNYKQKEDHEALVKEEVQPPQVEGQQTHSISSMSVEIAKSGTLLTMHAVSYCAESLLNGTNQIVDELKSNITLPGMPAWLLPKAITIPAIPNWVQPAIPVVLGHAAPALIIASEIAQTDPTGLRGVFQAYASFKLYLTCTKAAAEVIADTIETGNFKEAAISKTKEVAASYIPSAISSYFSNKKSTETLKR